MSPSSGTHEARAQELDARGFHRLAEQVRKCGTAHGYGRRIRRCNSRLCPSCADRQARQRADRVWRRIRRMDNPVLFLVTYPSKGLNDLRAALVGLRHALCKLRRRAAFRGVRSGVSAIETKLADNKMQWAVHIHLVLDIPGDFAVDEVNAAWRSLTEGRGKFEPSDEPQVQRWQAEALARYLTKPETWCPRPGELPGEALEILLRALHGRRLLVEWGFNRRGRRAPAPPLVLTDATERDEIPF